MKHLRSWGAVYILALLFAGSWAGQMATMVPETGWQEFWAATFENWQSEWLQLVFQAILLLGAKHWIFRAEAKDLERVEAKIDSLLRERAPVNIQLERRHLPQEEP